MKQLLLLFLLTIASVLSISAQEKDAELTMHLLENDKITEVNLDQEKFINSISQIIDYIKNDLKDVPKTQKIGILTIVHTTGKPTYKCYSEPKIDSASEAKILKDLNAFTIENTKLVDFPILITLNDKEGGENTSFKDFVTPAKQRVDEYKAADLATMLRLNKEYAINVLPVLCAYQTIVDDKFAGVKNFGKLIAQTDFRQSQDINSLINSNKNYWRATMEMEPGNQLIPVTKIFALAAQGELDHAKKYIEMISLFSNPKTHTNNYLEELDQRITLFNKNLEEAINNGIKEHDKGNYDNAIAVYDQLLKVYPNSSWALYEKYFSENAKKLAENKIAKEERTDWDNAKIEIYKHNPLYNMDVRASTGKEAYLLFRRHEISTLFKDKEAILNDVFKYAEIATDLGAYDFAAQLFWLSATHNDKNKENSLHNYLYCLDKLGEKELKSNFNGNFEKIFKKIEQEKEGQMKKDPVYKSMKK